jgi:hypothetical protein
LSLMTAESTMSPNAANDACSDSVVVSKFRLRM